MRTKMKLLLLLCCVLWVSADVLHEDLAIGGCSENDRENMYTLEGEEVWYADFKQRKGIDPQPPFVDHVTCPECYEAAVAYQQICRTSLKTALEALKDLPLENAEPYVRLYSTTPPAGRHPAMLVCRVYDFYPKTIRVSWLRDGQEVTSDVTSTDEMEDGDWYYQIQSHLEYTPRSGEKISCKVEHASLKEPLIKDWDPSMPESERNKIAIGASGLILGLILSLAGFIYYRRKAKGRILVPSI